MYVLAIVVLLFSGDIGSAKTFNAYSSQAACEAAVQSEVNKVQDVIGGNGMAFASCVKVVPAGNPA